MLHLRTSQAFISETCAPLLHVLGGGTGVAGKRSRVVLRVDDDRAALLLLMDKACLLLTDDARLLVAHGVASHHQSLVAWAVVGRLHGWTLTSHLMADNGRWTVGVAEIHLLLLLLNG